MIDKIKSIKYPTSIRLPILLIVVVSFWGGLLLWAQKAGNLSDSQASTAGFYLLLPLGLILLLSSALPEAEREAPQAITAAFVVWAIAVLTYFGVGFAFQFGGLANHNPSPDFAELYWNWSPLDSSFGTGWGVIGLRGWALLGEAATPGIFDLFLRHLALLGVVVVVPCFILYRHLNTLALFLFGLLMGSLIYPIVGNWIWSGGWLSNLGGTQGLGHGFIDAGITTPFALAGLVSLAALISFKQRSPTAETDDPTETTDAKPLAETEETTEPIEVPMPSLTVPLLTFFGLGMLLWGWTFAGSMAHLPTAADMAIPRAALNGILSALSGGLAAALYSHFTTTRFDLLMTVRGSLAGLVAVSTVASFVPPWQAIVVGLLVGILTPLLIYWVDHKLRLADHTAAVATFALLGILAWLLPGLLADGTRGVGWNGMGTATYLGVEGQGISGLFVAADYVRDWPGQLNAQLLGMLAIAAWTMALSLAFFRSYVWLSQREWAPVEMPIDEDGAAEAATATDGRSEEGVVAEVNI